MGTRKRADWAGGGRIGKKGRDAGVPQKGLEGSRGGRRGFLFLKTVSRGGGNFSPWCSRANKTMNGKEKEICFQQGG